MEPNNNYEQEIDLKDLMFAVLRKWRPIIVIAVVFAVLLGALKTVKGIRQLGDEEYVKKNQDTYVMNLDQYNSTKGRLEKEIENLQQNIYKTIIPRNVRLAEAPSYGQPITLYDPRSTGAEAYRLLAEEVINREVE